ncbi:MAG: hypothetical protein DRG30_09625 [Epsilonproteobacteria bacterium]|nr:MAG: hypothetical protein DRG30_09625 [Campylobacterota bacterium]
MKWYVLFVKRIATLVVRLIPLIATLSICVKVAMEKLKLTFLLSVLLVAFIGCLVMSCLVRPKKGSQL